MTEPARQRLAGRTVVVLGAAGGAILFSYTFRKPLLEIADALVIPGAFLMGVGRIGNFIDGLIVGRVTDVAWAVQFPDAAGFRHPVVLYDGAKNLLLIPYLLWVRRTNPTPGAATARPAPARSGSASGRPGRARAAAGGRAYARPRRGRTDPPGPTRAAARTCAAPRCPAPPARGSRAG